MVHEAGMVDEMDKSRSCQEFEEYLVLIMTRTTSKPKYITVARLAVLKNL